MLHFDDLGVELDSVHWREYKVRTLVPKDMDDAGGSPEEFVTGAANWAEQIIRKAQRPDARLSLEEWLVFDLLRSHADNVRTMGPCYDARVCERGHVIDAEEGDRGECGYCEAEAEQQAEARSEG